MSESGTLFALLEQKILARTAPEVLQQAISIQTQNVLSIQGDSFVVARIIFQGHVLQWHRLYGSRSMLDGLRSAGF